MFKALNLAVQLEQQREVYHSRMILKRRLNSDHPFWEKSNPGKAYMVNCTAKLITAPLSLNGA